MKTSDDLLYDHEVLRGQLMALEEQLPWAEQVRHSLSHLTDRLASCLRDHTSKEEIVYARLPCPADSPAAACVRQLCDEHENHHTRLAILHGLLTQPGPAPAELFAVEAEEFIRDVRVHMAAEEQFLFPWMEWAEAGAGAPATYGASS